MTDNDKRLTDTSKLIHAGCVLLLLAITLVFAKDATAANILGGIGLTCLFVGYING